MDIFKQIDETMDWIRHYETEKNNAIKYEYKEEIISINQELSKLVIKLHHQLKQSKILQKVNYPNDNVKPLPSGSGCK